MTRLERPYHKIMMKFMAEKVNDESDDLVEQIDREIIPPR